MGSELSCPCTRRNPLEEDEQPKEKVDIVEEVMRGKLLSEQLIYEYTYDQSKVCLIKVNQLEGFFANRQLLKLITKKEINYYYNIVFVTNFMGENNLVFVLLQYTPGMEDKSFINSSVMRYNNNNKKGSKKRSTVNLDYSTNYKVEKLNLVSNEKNKVIGQLLNDLNANVKKDFIFYGIVNDYDLNTVQDTNNISQINLRSSFNSVSAFSPRNFKILYKRSLLKDIRDCKYSVYEYEGQLDREIINEILSNAQNKNKLLKSIMIDCTPDLSVLKKNYYFIFEEVTNTPEVELDYLVIEMEQGNNSNRIFLQDIATKLNDFQNPFKLCCLVSDDKKFYLILYSDSEMFDNETPFENEFEYEMTINK